MCIHQSHWLKRTCLLMFFFPCSLFCPSGSRLVIIIIPLRLSPCHVLCLLALLLVLVLFLHLRFIPLPLLYPSLALSFSLSSFSIPSFIAQISSYSFTCSSSYSTSIPSLPPSVFYLLLIFNLLPIFHLIPLILLVIPLDYSSTRSTSSLTFECSTIVVFFQAA